MLDRNLGVVNLDDKKWNLNQLLFWDDTAVVTNSEARLKKKLIEELGRVCKGRKLRVKESKSKIMRCKGIVVGRR